MVATKSQRPLELKPRSQRYECQVAQDSHNSKEAKCLLHTKSSSQNTVPQRFGITFHSEYLLGAEVHAQGRTPSHFNVRFCISLSHPFSFPQISLYAILHQAGRVFLQYSRNPWTLNGIFFDPEIFLPSPKDYLFFTSSMLYPVYNLCPLNTLESKHSTCLCIGSFYSHHWRNPQETLEQELNFLIK